MEGQDEVSVREQHFHSQVRESTICFLLFAVLYIVSYFIIRRYKRKSDEQEDEDAIVNRISTPLHLACTIGHADMVTLLVQRKCQLNLCDKECRTPLMKAIQYQEETCVTILLEHGANPHLTDNFGNTALHYAVAGDNTSIVEKLILYHANIEARNKLELTPFLLAVNENKHQMVELLIGKKADVHVVDKSKRTALMLAATFKSPDVVRLLLQQGVNTSSQDECGWTAEDYADFCGFYVNRQIIAQHREERFKNFSPNNNPDFSAELDLEMTTEKEEESLNESENKHLQIEETEKHQNDEMAVLESVCASAAAGLMHQRGSGKTDNNLCPIMENEESDGAPALDIKEVRKGDKEKQTSEESVITSRFEKAPSLTSHPLQMNDDNTSSGMDQDEGRSAKKTSSDKEKVKKQIDSMDDFDDLTPSSETISEGFRMPCSNYMICMSLIEQHGMDCKDPVSLLKIQEAVLSYERLIEFKKYHCGQLKRENKKMENKANELQKELLETKEMISKLELQKVEWKQELYRLRFTLKQENKNRAIAEMLHEKIREQLTRKEEQYKKEVEMKQELELNLRALDMELRTVRNNFNQVVEEQYDTEKQLCRKQDARILQDGILNNHLCKQKEIEMDNKMSSGVVVRKLQEELADTLKKLSMSESSLEVTSRCRMNLEDEVQDLKKKLAQSRNQVDDLTAKLETMSSKNQSQVAFHESRAQLREHNNASVRSQMELRIKELESELSKMKTCQDVTKTESGIYEHLYLEEVKHGMSLTNELNKTSERLAETSTKLLVEKQQKQTLLDTINMRPALDLPYGRNVNHNSSLFNRNVALRGDVVIHTSNSRRSSNDIETFLTKMQQELEKNIARGVKEAYAEFESHSSIGATSLESTFERHTSYDDVLESYRDYSQFLKKKYSI